MSIWETVEGQLVEYKKLRCKFSEIVFIVSPSIWEHKSLLQISNDQFFPPSERFLQPNRNDFFIDFAKCSGTRVINIKNMWTKTENKWDDKISRVLKWQTENWSDSKLDDSEAEKKKAISICHFRFHLGHVLWLLQNWDFFDFLFRWHFWWNFHWGKMLCVSNREVNEQEREIVNK